jgi:LmbE family N-acetylglucosaminyl deacetylase
MLCGGTLAKYALAGHGVSMAAVCRSGTRYPECTEEMLEQHTREYRNAAAVIGASTCYLQLPQFDVRNDHDTRLKLTEVIRQVQPKLILTHDSNDYLRDLRTTSEIVTECMFMARQPGIKTGSSVLAQHPFVVFMDTISGLGFEPEQYVDITKVMEVKRRMLSAFETELEEYKDNPVVEPLEWMEVTNRFRGIQCGRRYAEAFRWPHRWGFMPNETVLI